MTLESMDSLLGDLLKADSQQALAEFGAVESELAPSALAPGEHFTVVAARGGDDIWIELRRRRSAAARADRSAVPASTEIVAALTSRPGPASSIPEPGVVLPMSRTPVRSDTPARTAIPRLAGLDRLLRLASARGAEALYLLSNARPAIRVDGAMSALEGEAPLGPQDVESLMLDVWPDRGSDPLSEGTEWICDIADVGRVRCLAFTDQRGPGGIFRMKEIQALCNEPEGLVLVTGPRASGKSTLLSAFVDVINRTRSEHVISLESQVKVVHESRSAVVSQREVRGGPEELLATLRAALRESPDVIVIEDLRSPEVIAEAVEAAASGYLVIAGIAAHTAPEAVAKLLEQAPADRRQQLQTTLAETLRGVVAQVLLKKSGGGRVAARELLLGSPAVASIIAEGRIAQLSLAMESGRRQGMVPLTDALVGFIRSGAVDVREAWRRASDRAALLKQLKREGIDTSFVERLA
jgi:twitching motility protein PilT